LCALSHKQLSLWHHTWRRDRADPTANAINMVNEMATITIMNQVMTGKATLSVARRRMYVT
jgi:hypothetical protein